jgi:hypothetical protein
VGAENSFDGKCKADERVEELSKKFLGDLYAGPYLPWNDFIRDKYGVARVLSLPENSDECRSNGISPAKLFVFNYMKLMICPRMEGIQEGKKMEVRFFVPESLVSILHYTESSLVIPDLHSCQKMILL